MEHFYTKNKQKQNNLTFEQENTQTKGRKKNHSNTILARQKSHLLPHQDHKETGTFLIQMGY